MVSGRDARSLFPNASREEVDLLRGRSLRSRGSSRKGNEGEAEVILYETFVPGLDWLRARFRIEQEMDGCGNVFVFLLSLFCCLSSDHIVIILLCYANRLLREKSLAWCELMGRVDAGGTGGAFGNL